MLDKERIRNFQIFEDLSSEELDGILSFACQEDYPAGEVILEEACSTASSDLFVILKGMIKVELAAIKNHMNLKTTKRLAVLKDGAIFGEIGLLKGKGRTAKVAAYSDVSLLRIDQWKLYGHLEANHHLGYMIMKNLAVILSDRLVDVNFMWRDDI